MRRSSIIIAFLVTLSVCLWMFSDDFLESDDSNYRKTETSIPWADDQNSGFIVSATRVVNQTVDQLTRSSGSLVSNSELDLEAKVIGEILNLGVSEGNLVNTGKTLVTIDQGTLKEDQKVALDELDTAKRSLQVMASLAKSNKRSAEAELRAASKNFDVNRKLSQNNLRSEMDLFNSEAVFESSKAKLLSTIETGEIDLLKAEANVSAKIAHLAAIKKTIEDSTVKSPLNGTVETIFVELGEMARPGKKLMTIIDLSSLKLVTPVPQTSINKIQLGQKVNINVASIGSFIGQVEFISGKANEATRTFDIHIRVSNKNGQLKSGMSAEAEIVTGQRSAFAMSPAHLSVGTNGDISVKKLNNGLAVIHPVEIVKATTKNIYVAGLKNGEIVLTNGQGFVSPGSKVRYKITAQDRY